MTAARSVCGLVLTIAAAAVVVGAGLHYIGSDVLVGLFVNNLHGVLK